MSKASRGMDSRNICLRDTHLNSSYLFLMSKYMYLLLWSASLILSDTGLLVVTCCGGDDKVASKESHREGCERGFGVEVSCREG